jgi:hypothetical protein
MSAALLEAHYIVREAAEPWTPGDSVKAGINRAARVLDLSFRRAKTFWYCAPEGRVGADEIDHLRRRHHELLETSCGALDAERSVIAAKLSALEETHSDAWFWAWCERAVDSSCAAGACQAPRHAAQVTGKDSRGSLHRWHVVNGCVEWLTIHTNRYIGPVVRGLPSLGPCTRAAAVGLPLLGVPGAVFSAGGSAAIAGRALFPSGMEEWVAPSSAIRIRSRCRGVPTSRRPAVCLSRRGRACSRSPAL